MMRVRRQTVAIGSKKSHTRLVRASTCPTTQDFAGLLNENVLGGEFAAVPEPSSIVLCLFAGVGFLAYCWRRRWR